MQRSHIHWHWQALAGPSCLIGSDVVVYAVTSPHTYILEALMLPFDSTEATDGTATGRYDLKAHAEILPYLPDLLLHICNIEFDTLHLIGF